MGKRVVTTVLAVDAVLALIASTGCTLNAAEHLTLEAGGLLGEDA